MARSRARNGGFERSVGKRETIEHSSAAHLLISFAQADFSQPSKAPQDFSNWAAEGLLTALMDKVRHLNQLTFLEAQQQQLISVYGHFPTGSEFNCPVHLDPQLNWGVLKNIGGQKARVAGYFDRNLFYLVFLDKEHQFWPSPKRNS